MPTLTPQQVFELAISHHQAGRLEQAVAGFRQAITLRPDFADAHNRLGSALSGLGQWQAALEAFNRAIACKPEWPQAHNNLANALLATGQVEQAIASYRRAIALNPRYVDAHCNLGIALKESGRLDEAQRILSAAIALAPNSPQAHHNLGLLLLQKDLPAEAVGAFAKAIGLQPAWADAHHNLGLALQLQGLLEQAIAAFQRAIALNPRSATAYSSLGNALRDKGALAQAIAAHRQAVAIDPANVEAHYYLGLALLLQGQLEEGWKEHEWRYRIPDFPDRGRQFAQPRWDGSEQPGKTLLICGEQGFGDILQFCRYFPLAAERVGRMIVSCPPPLRRLLSSIPCVSQFIGPADALPPFDLHCSLLSLPLLFGTTLATIPPPLQAIAAPAELFNAWRQRFSKSPQNLRVGLAWAGNPAFVSDRLRSPRDLSLLAPLGDVPGIVFFSLQKGLAAAQIQQPPAGMQLINWADDLTDFADTAAMISQLDLMISSDTAVAHLAATLGKPVWLMLSHVPDWRWLMDRTDSPWYPTMRLFRQPAIAQWPAVIEAVKSALSQLAIRPS